MGRLSFSVTGVGSMLPANTQAQGYWLFGLCLHHPSASELSQMAGAATPLSPGNQHFHALHDTAFGLQHDSFQGFDEKPPGSQSCHNRKGTKLLIIITVINNLSSNVWNSKFNDM